MSDEQIKCPQCGAALGPADLQMKACRYCGTMHPHVARAAEKVELVKQMLAPGPGGIPAAMQGMVAPWAGMMPNYGAPPQQPPYPGGPGAPPPFGGPMANTGYAPPMYGAPALDRARAVRRGIGAIVFVVIAFTFVLVLAGAGLAFWLTSR